MRFSSLVTRFIRAHSSNYKQSNRSVNDIKYIVIHFTANDGDSDESNANYFRSPNRKASAHFFVDDDSITQSVDIKNIAWHCGGSVYSDIAKTGGAKYHNRCTNANSIGIELCDTVKDGKHNISKKTYNNAVKLVRALMDDYNIDINHVIRHFDITGKYCPRYWCLPYGNNNAWNKFKNDIVNNKVTSDKNNNTEGLLYRVRKTWNDVKSQIGAYTNLDNAKKACKDGYNVYDYSGKIVYSYNLKTGKSNAEVAREVVDGKWGKGDDRKKRLTDAGYDYLDVQRIVNHIING